MSNEPKTVSITVWTPPIPLWLLLVGPGWHEIVPILSMQARLFENGCVRHQPVVLVDEGWVCDEEDFTLGIAEPFECFIVRSNGPCDEEINTHIAKVQKRIGAPAPIESGQNGRTKSQHGG